MSCDKVMGPGVWAMVCALCLGDGAGCGGLWCVWCPLVLGQGVGGYGVYCDKVMWQGVGAMVCVLCLDTGAGRALMTGDVGVSSGFKGMRVIPVELLGC